MKRIIALTMAATLAMQTPVYAAPYTDDEIEKRITEVGEEYMDFLKQGETEWEEDAIAYGATVQEEASNSGILGGLSSLFSSRESVSSAALAKGAAETADAGMAYEESGEAELYMPEPFDMQPMNTEKYAPVEESGFVSVETQPFSTFGADVDTASYSSLRRRLMEDYCWNGENIMNFTGIDDSAIRLEEMVNYFNYHYAEPEDGEKFGVTTTLSKCPWNKQTLLFKVGIKAEEIKENNGSNIVFLIDTSGSMFDYDKLPLVKQSLEILLKNLDENDTISIVTYAGSEEVVAEGVKGNKKEDIMSAINALEAWGSTYGEGGITKAYEIAEKYYIDGGNNRVILCTDGDFNVGVSSEAGLKDLISKKKENGVFFSCLGFGGGNYNDTTMETLADNGNGNYFYIDCLKEAERALNEEFFSTIYTVAKDTKFQVEFNPATVKGYRLIGYENRKMAAEDFADDTKDGGEVGSGQTVTVLYEVVPTTSDFEIPSVESRYGKEKEEEKKIASQEEELMVVNIRYKEPDADKSVLREYPITGNMLSEMDEDTSWAAGVAQAAMVMRDSAYAGTTTLEDVYDRLKNDSAIMDNDYKAEFLFMLRGMKKYKEQDK